MSSRDARERLGVGPRAVGGQGPALHLRRRRRQRTDHHAVRETGELLNQWGRHGRQPGQFKWVHNIAIDSKGNLYTAEVGFGRRVQKFRRQE